VTRIDFIKTLSVEYLSKLEEVYRFFKPKSNFATRLTGKEKIKRHFYLKTNLYTFR